MVTVSYEHLNIDGKNSTIMLDVVCAMKTNPTHIESIAVILWTIKERQAKDTN